MARSLDAIAQSVVAELRALVEQLRQGIAELEARRNKNSHNSNKPPFLKSPFNLFSSVDLDRTGATSTRERVYGTRGGSPVSGGPNPRKNGGLSGVGGVLGRAS